jgi:hypothetical protein
MRLSAYAYSYLARKQPFFLRLRCDLTTQKCSYQSKAMATASQGVRTAKLNQSEQNAVTDCMKLVDAAPLREDSDSEVDLTNLDDVMRHFSVEFSLWTKVR